MEYDFIELVHKLAFQTGEFTLTSGAKSSFYIDCRKLTLDSEGLFKTINQIIKKIDPFKPKDDFQAVGGPTIGADPIVGAYLAMMGGNYIPLNGFLVRKEAKKHGTKNQIEGNLNSGDRCIVFEDVTTTGQSGLDAVEAVRAYGGEVIQLISIVDRLSGAADLYHENGVWFTPLITIDDLWRVERRLLS